MATNGTPKENPNIVYMQDRWARSITIYYHDKIDLAIGMEEIGAELQENIFGWEIEQGNDPQLGDFFTFHKLEEEGPPEPERVYTFIQTHQSYGGSSRPTTPRGPS